MYKSKLFVEKCRQCGAEMLAVCHRNIGKKLCYECMVKKSVENAKKKNDEIFVRY
ncbi:MAG: hypothetical protein R3321_05755 [Nitrososphaeraceae archaeon]|nr:hypothetical protein [Nitrososphaeraceae archaeon]